MTSFPRHPRQTLLDYLFGTVRDANGKRVRVVRGDRRRRNLRERRREFKKVRWRATPAWAKWMLGLTASAVILALAAGFAMIVVAGLFQTEFAPWVGQLLAISILGSLISMLGAGVVMSVVDDRAAIRALLSMRVCVRCFYDLRGTPDGGGVCVCPECGTAWRTRTEVHD